MNVVVNFKVRNPEWYWSKEEMAEKEDFRPLFEMINGDKIEKHIPAWQYGFPFEVLKIEDNCNAVFPLEFVVNEQKLVYDLHDCTHVQFIGKDKKADAVVCNSLLHQYIAAHKSGTKYYVYFYIKENIHYDRLGNMIFLNEEEILKVDSLLIAAGAE
jgi:hypothetical protein